MELESGSKKENDSLLLEPEAEIDHQGRLKEDQKIDEKADKKSARKKQLDGAWLMKGNFVGSEEKDNKPERVFIDYETITSAYKNK